MAAGYAAADSLHCGDSCKKEIQAVTEQESEIKSTVIHGSKIDYTRKREELHPASEKSGIAYSESSIQIKGEHIYNSLLSSTVWKFILGGLYTTVVIFIFSALFAILLATILTYMGINNKWPWLYKPLNWFVSTIHDVPSVVLMMFFYYAIFGGDMDGLIVSIIALAVYSSGALAKIFKIHIQQVGKGQLEAGMALGLTKRQCYRYIVLPQALKSMLPLFIAELKSLLRATSYAGYIAQKDLVKAVDSIRIHTSDSFVPLVLISILYLALSWLIANAMNKLYKKAFDHD